MPSRLGSSVSPPHRPVGAAVWVQHIEPRLVGACRGLDLTLTIILPLPLTITLPLTPTPVTLTLTPKSNPTKSHYRQSKFDPGIVYVIKQSLLTLTLTLTLAHWGSPWAW